MKMNYDFHNLGTVLAQLETPVDAAKARRVTVDLCQVSHVP